MHVGSYVLAQAALEKAREAPAGQAGARHPIHTQAHF